ncbi:MAG: hypothetical protein OEU32_07630 [Acidimicrobiia bacterium]|nr:hypothetical protein [Acidimicrobiia bacterium]
MATPTTSPRWKQRHDSLSARASRLRSESKLAADPLARAYRRRAAELELEAFAIAVRSAAPGEKPTVLAA